MNSIADSVHRLLSDQIFSLGLEGFYEIQQGKIIGKNGTSFSFEGIKNNTLRIKSYEGVDYCWVEEAIKVSKTSWEILLPTIRKEGSEVWMTFNPELEGDYTYARWVLDSRLNKIEETKGGWISESEDSYVVKMTYKDNPWLTATTMKEIERDRARDYDQYLHVWEGNCAVNLEGAVFAKQLRRATEEGRICQVPWDPETPVNVWFDLGRRDLTAMWFGQRVAMQDRMLEYFEDSQEDITYYISEMQRKPYNYGTIYLPHDGRAKRLGMKLSIEEILRNRGYRVVIVPKYSISDGINAARLAFGTCWFDQVKCGEGLNRLRHYCFKVMEVRSVEGQLQYTLSEEPIHDDNSNGADAFRYFAVSRRVPSSGADEIKARLARAAEEARGKGNEVEYGRRGGSDSLGWMA